MPRIFLTFWFFLSLAAVAAGQSPMGGEKRVQDSERSADSILAHYAYIQSDTQYIDSLIGACMRLLGSDPKTAQGLASVAESRARQIPDQKRLARSYLMQGSIFRQYGALDLAMRYFEQALELSERLGQKGLTGSAYNNIATIKGAEGDMRGSIYYFRKSREMLIASGNIQFACVPLQNIAAGYSEIGDHDRAIAIYDTVIAELNANKNLQAMSSARNNLGTIYLKLKDYKHSRQNFWESKALKAQVGDNAGMSDLLLNMVDYYLAVNQTDSARNAAIEGRRLAETIGAKSTVANAYHKLALVERTDGNYKVATDHYERFIQLKDSVESEAQAEARGRLLTAFDIKRKEAEIGLLSKDKEIQEMALDRANVLKWVFGIGIAALLALIVVLLRNNRQRAKVNASLSVMNAQVTDQKRQIELQNTDLKAQNDQLAVLNREMDGILHVVAHDLKAPLNQATSLAQLVEATGELNAEQRKYLSMIAKVSENAGRLVRDLLEISQLEGGGEQVVQSPIDVSALCLQVTDQFGGEATRKQITLTVDAPQLPQVRGNESMLRRVLENLVSNALKFSPHGSKVSVVASHDERSVRIRVCDNGPGISVEEQGMLFQKFARLSARPTGGESSSGLGLAIVKMLVEQLGGEISLQSEVGKGSTFEVCLPVHTS